MPLDHSATILLGAGASADAGIPLAKEMARQMYQTLRNSDEYAACLRVAIAGLRFQQSFSPNDPFGDIDIENLYEVLVALGERSNNSIAPFVGAWSDAVKEAEGGINLEKAARKVAEELERSLHDALDARKRRDVNLYGFEREVREALQIAASGKSKMFQETARVVLQRLPSLCWVRDASKVEYFTRLLASARASPLWIATLNYDNTIELAATSLGLTIDTGLRDQNASVRFEAGHDVTLAKLHGSLNWHTKDGTSLVVHSEPVSSPMLIFGSGNKLQVEGPYLDLMFSFRDRLQSTSTLHVCGYSFRDRHINHLILRWLELDNHRFLHIYDKYLSLSQIAQNMSNAVPRQQRMPYNWLMEKATHHQVPASEAFLTMSRATA